MKSELLNAEGLTVSFDGKAILKDLDLTLNRGEVVGLLGASGSGKSTLAYALMGLTRGAGTIDRGKVCFEGNDLLTMDANSQRAVRGRQIGLVTQNPRLALNPLLSVGEQLRATYLAHNDGTDQEAHERALEMLRYVGINDPDRRLQAYPHELSGGMVQRVLIAVSLICGPRLLIADEPTSGLDVTIQAQILDQLWASSRKDGSSVLIITQEPGIVANYCDRLVVLDKGRIVEDTDPKTFFAAPVSDYGKLVQDFVYRAKEAEASSGSLDTVREDETPVLRASGLTKTFPVRNSTKRVQAVNDVSFDLNRGETLGLVGESGSGKTTVGRCLLRLEEPDDGLVSYRDMTLRELSDQQLRRIRGKVQIVLQDPYDSLNPRWTIERSLREPLDMHTDLDRSAKSDRIDNLLRQVGLDPAVRRAKPRALGSGELQRICLARALACGPDFIVLDEPTSVLEPRARIELVELLVKLQRETGVSYLMISHDLETVRAISQRIAVMYLSQIVEIGSAERIFEEPQHPYTKALISAYLSPLPDVRRVDNEDITALTGEIPSPIDLPKGCYLSGRCPFEMPSCAQTPQNLADAGNGVRVRCSRQYEINLNEARKTA